MEESQPEMDALLELAFLCARVWKLCCFTAYVKQVLCIIILYVLLITINRLTSKNY